MSLSSRLTFFQAASVFIFCTTQYRREAARRSMKGVPVSRKSISTEVWERVDRRRRRGRKDGPGVMAFESQALAFLVSSETG